MRGVVVFQEHQVLGVPTESQDHQVLVEIQDLKEIREQKDVRVQMAIREQVVIREQKDLLEAL